MDSKKLKEKWNSLDNSNRIFKNIVSNCKQPKFEHLDRWQHFQAYSFNEENNSNHPRRFKTYKRGTIIFVNFGTSIGSELSGHHFAIVLSKKDNPYNATLTVLPLTSKSKKYNLDLGKHISLMFAQKIGDDLVEFLSAILDMDIVMHHTKEISMSFDGNVLSGEELRNFLTNIPNNQKLIDRIDISKIENRLSVQNDTYSYVSKWITDMDQIEKYYKSKQKDSYGIINGITTVSKYRINKPINKLDPIGKVKVSEHALKLIDLEIMKNLTSIELTSASE